ncbi:CLUMA_CG006945, isoform A [Clunio marinus]|uniref:CLUMA_CG006945, isoform A n=1 Tax=Clunio marinus TaxID=568069 RepID=A0A1J1I4V4_9DIPT|nr:CLUMA_CG006945, isoform A [Clunio marinus]
MATWSLGKNRKTMLLELQFINGFVVILTLAYLIMTSIAIAYLIEPQLRSEIHKSIKQVYDRSHQSFDHISLDRGLYVCSSIVKAIKTIRLGDIQRINF